jgi:hypothetical protein
MAHSIEQPARQSVMRYSLRALLVATLAVAVVSAIVGPLLRMWNADGATLWHIFGGASIGAALSVGFRCWRRYQIERQCGELLLMVPMRINRSRPYWLALQIVGGFAVIAVDAFLDSIPRPNQRPFNIMSVYGGLALADAFLSIWWKGVTYSTELCRNGVIVGSNRLTPWSVFRGYRWIYNGNIQLAQRFAVIDVIVPAELRSRVDEVLGEHLPCLSMQSFSSA